MVLEDVESIVDLLKEGDAVEGKKQPSAAAAGRFLTDSN